MLYYYSEVRTGSKTERPVSALLSDFHTESLSRDVASFVTSVLASRSQSKLVRKSHCFFLPLRMTRLRSFRLFIEKTRLKSSGSCQFDAWEATEGGEERCVCGLGRTLVSCFLRKEGRSILFRDGWNFKNQSRNGQCGKGSPSAELEGRIGLWPLFTSIPTKLLEQ